jgi:hypothetical protein
MIELKNDILIFSFPEVHPEARLKITMQRTLRIPDDGAAYPLPPGVGRFPVRHIDDYAENIPQSWLQRGGVIVPMYQAEALWLNFDSEFVVCNNKSYPFAVKIATGKINAITGEQWDNRLSATPQDYIVVPEQPWLDGYCVEKGYIRQFVAMPLGAGYTAEEQFTGGAELGGLQILVRPMKREVFERRFPKLTAQDMDILFNSSKCCCAPSMGLAPGGRMRQKIYDDPFDFDDWSAKDSSRCFVHLVNSMTWRSITGQEPPTVPFTASEYTDAGLPWFDLYDESAEAVEGSKALKNMKSVAAMGKDKGDVPLPENKSTAANRVHMLRHGLKKDQIREEPF